MKTLLLFSLFSLSAYSQVQIQVVDPKLDVTPLKDDKYQIQTMKKETNIITDKTIRDNFFSGTELPKAWGP
jgi:hypothetical protein